MIIKDLKVVVYDIEVFSNCFHCCCKDTETGTIIKFEISERVNQLSELVDFFHYKNEDKMFCGYNNHHYDDVIINYIIDFYYKMSNLPFWRICLSLFNLSQQLVNSEDGPDVPWKKWKYAKYFYSMDLLTMQFSRKLRVGLKTMQVTMHYKNVQEYEGDFGAPIPVGKIDEMIAYNINDVESTTELLNRLSKDIELRLSIEKEYGIDCLSMDSVKMAETFLLEEISKRSGIPKNVIKEMRSPMDWIPLKDVILPFIKYKNPKLQSVLEEMKGQVVYSKERKGYEKKFVLSNVVYSIGVGGIHSINKPGIFRPKDDEVIKHVDAASMYPSLLIEWQLGPRHLGKIFCDLIAQVKVDRLEAKHTGQKVKNAFLKIVLNGPTGKMQQEESWMYDPFNVFRIRINGQLILLMLVDKLLEIGCEMININTDGIFYRAKKSMEDKINIAVKEIEDVTRLVFESDEYEGIYQSNVNGYFGVLKGGEVEEKGTFITETKLGKGLKPVVIPKAVINYFMKGEPIEEFIKSDGDIRDFLISQKVDKKFEVWHGENRVQRINRFYASTDGPYLFKYDPQSGREKENMLTKSGVTILNELYDTTVEGRKINYRYYISEAKKIVADFTEQQLSLFNDQQV